MKNMTFKEFKQEFKTYDKGKVWNTKEIKFLYIHLMEIYGYVNEDNFSVEYAIDNKNSIIY